MSPELLIGTAGQIAAGTASTRKGNQRKSGKDGGKFRHSSQGVAAAKLTGLNSVPIYTLDFAERRQCEIGVLPV